MIKEEILNLTGNKNEVLTEGVKYFKFSKRFDNLITKAAKSKNSKKREFISAMKSARDDFKKAENEFDLGNKVQAKQSYQIAKAKHSSAIKKLLSAEMKSFILRAGLFGGFSAILFLLTKGAIDFKASGKLDSMLTNMESSSKDIVRELQYLGKEKDVEYYNRKWNEIGKRSLATAKELYTKTSDEVNAVAPESLKNTVSKIKDAAANAYKGI